ncbi:HD-GYP domain-containing protein [Rubripirellula obstinata]|nr:HD domain-containing phosphohydrolase [Rubripirellula obstinata]
MTDEDSVRIPIEDIAIDIPCQCDVKDDLGTLTLMAGNAITAALRDQLIQRGVSHLEVSPQDADALLANNTANDAGVKGAKPAAASANAKRAGNQQRKDRSQETYSPVRAAAFQKQLSKSVSELASIGRRIDQLSNRDIQTACELPKALLEMVLDDCDQSIASIDSANEQDNLAHRCAQMSMLAINTGIEMEFDSDRLELLGQSGLLHDFGLYRLAPELRDPSAILTSAQQDEYRRHPNITQDLLKKFTIASDEIRVIVSQVHERPDGQGYPRGLRSNLTHPLANVLSVVDGYLSLTEPGPNRDPIQAHDALVVMLHEGTRGRYDSKALRAFLTQITLFPIGSRVLLNDDCEATVMRRDAAHYATPIVQADGSDEFVFTRTDSRKIRRPAVSQKRPEKRLLTDQISRVMMEELIAA